MLDTVNFFVERAATPAGDPLAVAVFLSDIVERNSEKTGYSVTGKMGDYTVTCFNGGISLKGSLPKYFLPSNAYTLTRATVQQAIESLSDSLHIDISRAILTRADVSTVIPTQRPPADYYQLLGNKPHFKRVLATADTLYYTTAQRQAIFYDKTREAAAKGAIIPPALAGYNLLRYELRFLHRLKQQFRQTDRPTGRLLYEPNFYSWLVCQWAREFESITKLKHSSIMSDNLRTPKEAKNAVLSYALQRAGGQNLVEMAMAEARAKKLFTDPKYYTRLKADLNAILATPTTTGDSGDLMEELGQKVSDIAKYAR